MSRELIIILVTAALIILIHIGIIYSFKSGFYQTFTKAWTSLQDPFRQERQSLEELHARLQELEEEKDDDREPTD